jgi:hypothetical protein
MARLMTKANQAKDDDGKREIAGVHSRVESAGNILLTA